MNHLSLRHWGLDAHHYSQQARLVGMALWISYFTAGFTAFAIIDVIRLWDFLHHQRMPVTNPHVVLASLYLLLVIIGFVIANYYRVKKNTGNLYIVSISTAVFLSTLLSIIIEFLVQLIFIKITLDWASDTLTHLMRAYWRQVWPAYLIATVLLMMMVIIRWRLMVYRQSIQRDAKDTSGHLGAARLASDHDLTQYNLRGQVGGLLGKDAKGYLRHPKLTDRLILAYRGEGKTSTILIPFILDYRDVNKFITDIKGELTAVTAKKAIEAGRLVVVLDPFQVLKSLGIDIATHGINPLTYMPHDDVLGKDRFISALAAALCSSDQSARSETESHFSENAQIILEGVLDYYVDAFQSQSDKMNLVALHDWWLGIVNDEKTNVFNDMQNGSPKTQAAASQLLSAGKEESGSMKTTVYRQLQWLRSDNVRQCFARDDVDLDQFITGECDIYVVLPEDMIHAYSRMVRVIMALIKVKLIQADTRKLKSDYCFVLDELGQFGYCPDVEQVINTMRSRGLKVWAAFQTISQIEVYKDEAIFKGMPVKHFLGSDDIKTLKWIQELGGKTTVLTENISRNTSRSAKGSRASTSESYSVSEAATDLIHFNDVREMSTDEQYIFIKGMRPIQCKKAYYYQEPVYIDRYETNPLEQ